jgi:hypothetical protein
MSNSAFTRRENNPDTRSISDHTKPTSNPTKLDDSDAVNASSTDSPGLSEDTATALAASTNLPYRPVDIEKIVLALVRGNDIANQQHIPSVSVQAQPDTQAIEGDIGPKGGLSRTKTDNLYTTFAFLVEALAKTAPKYRVKDAPNINAIASHIEELATFANKRDKLSGQSHEAIKDRIEDAMKAKKEKLSQK